ncbi:hypothetical protein CCACVL1_08949 [Corchorus capsularis]|uniref:Uncharacterized protein n=1 Tax=Corchorus capsularis TaxID=210143 RepID=A0A1R3IY74_COCAP|nr:hypothetical protein CCACVL1_08949 [Corchorus capsularis]
MATTIKVGRTQNGFPVGSAN